MFNPFNPFQSAVNNAASAANNAGGANRAADATFGAAANPFSGPFTGNPFAGNPFAGNPFAGAQSTLQNGMQEWQRMLQSFMNPQKLFDPQTYKDLLPKELTQAWAAFTPGAMQEQASQATQAFQNAAQSMQGAMRSAAKSATEAASGNGYTGGTMGNGFGSSLGPVDMGAFVAAQQKNMETLASAQSAAIQSFQQVMKRQAEIFHDTIQTASTAMTDLMATGAPEEKLARQADIAKQAFEAAGKNVEELSQLVTKGQQEALRVVNARVQESLDEIKRAAQAAPMKQAATATAHAASGMMQQGAQAAQSMMQAAGSAGSQAATAAGDAVQ